MREGGQCFHPLFWQVEKKIPGFFLMTGASATARLCGAVASISPSCIVTWKTQNPVAGAVATTSNKAGFA